MRSLDAWCDLLGSHLGKLWTYLFGERLPVPADLVPSPIDHSRYTSFLEVILFGPSSQRTPEEQAEAMAFRMKG